LVEPDIGMQGAMRCRMNWSSGRACPWRSLRDPNPTTRAASGPAASRSIQSPAPPPSSTPVTHRTRTLARRTHIAHTRTAHAHDRELFCWLTSAGSGVSPQVQCVAYPADMSDPLLTHWNKSTSNPFLHSPPATFPQDNFRDPTTAW
jgi:hypothetical protein